MPAPTPGHVPLLRSLRGNTPEIIHYGSVAVVDRDGRIVVALGDVEAPQYPRSALKPFQALALLAEDGIGRLGFGSQELALACASHSGEAMHVAVVRRMLDRIGADESALQCGCHAPTYYATTGTPAPARRWTAISHNCSGKHSGFLCLCKLLGQDFASYLEPDAPTQARVRQTIEGFLGLGPLAWGVDGCSAPNYALPLRHLARSFARMAVDDRAELRALYYAMTRHPDLVSGTRRTDLALMTAGRGDWVTKIGADGVQAIGVRSRGLGIAIRVADGNARAMHAVTHEVLRQLDLLDETAEAALTGGAAEFKPMILRNARGLEVGFYEPAFQWPGGRAG